MLYFVRNILIGAMLSSENSADQDQTAPKEQFDPSLHCALSDELS